MTSILASITFSTLASLHSEAMSQHVYITDQEQYGVSDKWIPSLIGDCEDYALWVQQELRKSGTNVDIWIVRTEKGESHAVAVVGDLVLDIRSDKVVRRDRLSYKWIAPVEFYNKK